MPARAHQPTHSDELAMEQSLTELRQAIGDREQLAGDRDQARIDRDQLNHDARREDGSIVDRVLARSLDDRQAWIDRQQMHRDVNQETLDDAQEARDHQQHALGETRAMLELPGSQPPEAADPSAILRGASERARAARERAETALIRAQAALVRATAAEARARTHAPTDS